jgi:hypothetical protein
MGATRRHPPKPLRRVIGDDHAPRAHCSVHPTASRAAERLERQQMTDAEFPASDAGAEEPVPICATCGHRYSLHRFRGRCYAELRPRVLCRCRRFVPLERVVIEPGAPRPRPSGWFRSLFRARRRGRARGGR